MSSVSSLSGSTPDLFTVLQQFNSQNATDSSATAASALADPTQEPQEAQGHGHHHHHKGGGGVSGQIETAVTGALQDAKPGDDPNQVIQDAISSVLKGRTDGTQPNSQTTANPTDPTDPNAPTTASDTTTSQADFAALLKSFGVDPKQFQQDFQSAVQSVQSGGSVDFASLLKGFPPGSAVDTTG